MGIVPFHHVFESEGISHWLSLWSSRVTSEVWINWLLWLLWFSWWDWNWLDLGLWLWHWLWLWCWLWWSWHWLWNLGANVPGLVKAVVAVPEGCVSSVFVDTSPNIKALLSVVSNVLS